MAEPTKIYRSAAIAVTLCASGFLAYICEPLDGYRGWFLSQLAQKEDTVYAPQYSNAGFRKIAVGMTDEDVIRLVGKPLETYSVSLGGKQYIGWRFSRSANGASYRIRALLFREGRVSKIFREFYLD